MAIESAAPSTINSPERTAPSPHLVNYGGKVLDDPKFVSLYYGSYWNSARGRSDAAFLDRFGQYFVHSPLMGTLRGYGVKEASYGGSTFIPGGSDRIVDEADIKKIVKAEIKNNAVSAPDGETVYTVFLPPGSELRAGDGTSSYDGMGGYHGSFLNTDGTPVYYAAIVYSQGDNGIPFSPKTVDNLTITASHEWSEAATDPDVNRGKLGWYDSHYGEIGDIPIDIGLPLNQIWGRLGGFAVQKEWSNRDNISELQPK